MFLPQLKFVCKCCAILIAAIIMEVFLGLIIMLKLVPLLTTFGRFGTISAIVIGTIGVQLCVASLVIGIIGGKFIGGKPLNGFVLSGIYYLYFFTIGITQHPPELDFLTILLFLGLPLVVILGGLIYTKTCKSTSRYKVD